MNSSRSWLVWGTAVAAYMVAVLQRSSLGVAGVEATERFEISASLLSSLGVVQIVVYAALQVPVGMLLDRVGPKALIVVGALLMLVGQLTLAVTSDLGLALVGRVLVGAGDAMTFISVLRLLSFWFSGRILPQASQWTGNIGQLGQILSVVPFSWLLQGYGWSTAFASAGVASAVVLVLVLLFVANSPQKDDSADPARTLRHSLRQLKDALRRPGTQLGFWSHFITQSPGTVFALLWGFPFMVGGLHYSHDLAAGLLALLVVAGIIAGPILGLLSALFPLRRSNLVLTAVTVILGTWTVVLAWPTEPPLWLMSILIFTMGVGGPGSLIGFDFARQFNPLRNLGSATGFVNVGGFLATFVIMFLMGVVLDFVNQWRMANGMPDELFSWEGFRVAFLVQFVVVGIGIAAMLHARRRTRRLLHEEEGIQVAPLWVVWVREWKRRHSGERPGQSMQ
ncbi:MAG TPA: MFS transporter [Homoserinimonas sp.]|nr:MFS transporter [Homoserinimonas sp.]